MAYKTYSELIDQYLALGHTLHKTDEEQVRILKTLDWVPSGNIVFTGCGSSYSICRALADCIQPLWKGTVVAAAGGDLMLHPDWWEPVFSRPALLITVSRSGSTNEIIYAVEEVKKRYPMVKILSFVCTVNSNAATVSDWSVELPWAFDESVCQTRSVTNLFAGALSFFAGVAGCKEITAGLQSLVKGGAQYLTQIEKTAQKLAEAPWKEVMVLCDGGGYGVAEEAALAFNEIAYAHSACKHVLDVRHGPMILIDRSTLVLAQLTKEGFEYERDLIYDLIQRGAQIAVVSDEPLPQIEGVSAQFAFGGPLHNAVSAVLLLNAAQMLSYYRAVNLGLDPDNPAGLDAWIALG